MKLLRMLTDKKGMSLIEAVASNIIIALVIITTMSIIINLRLQSAIAEERYRAYQDANLSREQIIDRLFYVDALAAIEVALGRSSLDGDTWILTDTAAQASCPLNFPCGYMFDLNGNDYNSQITFVVASKTLRLIEFTIDVEYFSNRHITVEGIIYG